MKVFISYAREDREAAKRLFRDFKNRSIDPWLDSECLLPGQPWESAIEEAIEECRFFVAILSNNSINKVGKVQRELRKALSILDDYPEGNVFLIPVRIDNCNPSGRLHEIQWVDMFPRWEEGLHSILKVIDTYTNPAISRLSQLDDVDEKVKLLTSSEMGQVLIQVLKLFRYNKSLNGRQVSLQLGTYGTLARAYLEMLRHQGMLLRRECGDKPQYSLSEYGEAILKAQKRS